MRTEDIFYFSATKPDVMLKMLFAIALVLFPFCLFAQNGSGCADTSYRMRFSSPGKEFRFYTHCNTADGGTVLIGYASDTGTSANSNIVLIKLNTTGGLVWKAAFQNLSGNGSYFSRIIEQSNGELVAYGYTRNFNAAVREIILLKFLANGALLWSNKYSLNSHFAANDVLHPYFVSEGLNHDLLLTVGGVHEQIDADSVYAVMARLNNAGDLIWSKAFTNDPVSWSMNPSGIYEKNGDVFTFGYVDNAVNFCSLYTLTPYAIKMNYTTGQPVLTKAYCHPYTASNSFEVGGSVERDYYNSTRLLDGRFAMFGRFADYSDKRYGYKVVFDDQLNLVKARQYDIPYTNGSTLARVFILPDETTHCFYFGGSTVKQIYWASLDSSEKIIRQRKMLVDKAGTGFGGYLNFGYRNSETYNFSTYYRINNQRYSLFTQLQRNDPSLDSCLGTDTTFVGSNPLGWSQTTWSWKSIIDNPLIASPITLTTTDFTVTTEPLCTQISRCDSLRIAGPDTVCTSNRFVSFTGTKNPDCRKWVLWEMNTAFIDSSYQPNDSTLNIRFKPLQSATAQSLSLFASAANCTVAKDTAQIVLLPGLKPLPPDTVVCGAVNIRLTPGKWGKNYLWQNGSTDSVFIATDTGRYTVRVQSFCGEVFTDTFTVARPRVSLSGNVQACRGDTVTLRATTGFVRYGWTANGNPIGGADSVLRILAFGPAMFAVSAQTASGCTVSDTVLVDVRTATPFSLGADARFCEGDSLTLQAPAAFTNYQWSNGSSASSLTVKAAGLYWLNAKDSNGCSFTDSLTVLPLYPKPVVRIAPKGVVCIRQTDTLRGGNFSSYRWSNGSGLAYLPVADTGTYWLAVVDANGCAGSDTAVIAKRVLPPVGFLPKDTAVCAGGAVELRPLKTFRSYWWSNGASSPSLTVSEARLYALRVSDADGCTGADSIEVSFKNCPNRIWFPSAFSPNGDGRNDGFKPFVEGRLIEYRLAVYNRWGQVIFTATDFTKAWNGQLNDAVQATGAFVWLCQYRFSGEERKTAKGTVTLIR